MRHLLLAAFALASVVGPSFAEDKKPACSGHGTSIDFVDTPSEAASLAKKSGKLVMILHVSGLFEDPRFT